jgi:hypothetical protein
MRRFSMIMLFLGLLAPLEQALGQCVSAEEQATAGLLALRNQMIVIALSCNRQAEYNHLFVLRFRPLLQSNDRAVLGYFQGRESAKDNFVTNMVNVMSRDASRTSGRFCAHGDRIIRDISALESRDQLLSYAASYEMSSREMNLCALNHRF